MATSNNTTPKKICSVCGRELPATTEYFYKAPRYQYGVSGQCRDCKRAYGATYRATHREELRAQGRDYIAKHREERHDYYVANRERIRENHRIWSMSHPDKMNAYRQKYYHSHYETHRIQTAAFQKTAKGRLVQKAAKHRRRARIHGNGGTYTPAELKAVIAAHTDQKGILRCAFCGKPIKDVYEIDHWIPVGKEGRNVAGNLRIMHVKCNRKKAAKLPQELGRLI